MTHTAHTWNNGDVLTAPLLNALEADLAATAASVTNIDNTADVNKPVSTAQAAADTAVQAYAIQRGNHTGTQTADTITDGTTNKAFLATERTKLAGIAAGATVNRTDAATDTAITAAVNGLINGAPGALNTLKELADAMGDDASFASTVTNALALKAPLASPTFTGTVTGITAGMVGLGNVNNTADTAKPISTAQQTALNAKAPLASPTFTGTPTLAGSSIATAASVTATLAAVAFNVKDYGAVGDGVTDDTAAITAWLTAAAAAGGNAFLPAGTYLTGPVTIAGSNFSIEGVGDSSVLLLKPGSNTDAVTVLAGTKQVTFRTFVIDGNKTNNTAGAGIVFNTTSRGRHRAYGIHIRNTAGDGFQALGTSSGTNEFIGFRIYNCDGRGAYITDHDSYYLGWDIGQAGLGGFDLGGGCNNRFVACNTWFSGRVTPAAGNGWYFHAGSARNHLANCQAQDCQANAISFFSVADNSAVGFTADSCSSAGEGVASGQLASAVLLNGATNCTVEGIALNRFPAKTMQYGVVLTGTTSNGCVIDLRTDGMGAGNYSAGSGIGKNVVRATDGSGAGSVDFHTASVLFGTDATYDLGSTTQRARNIYLSGRVTSTGGAVAAVNYLTAATNLDLTYRTVLISGGGSAVLPSAATAGRGTPYTIKNTTGRPSGVTSAGGTIDGATTYYIAGGASVDVYSDGTNWVTTSNSAGGLDPLGIGFVTTYSELVAAPGAQTMAAANDIRYARVLAGGAISSIGLNITTSSGNIAVAAYSATGTGRAKVPGALLASSGSVAAPASGFQTVSLGSTVVVQPGDFLALAADNTTFGFLGAGGASSSLYNGITMGQAAAFPPPATPASLFGTGAKIPLLVGI